jgi:hypothetical protein
MCKKPRKRKPPSLYTDSQLTYLDYGNIYEVKASLTGGQITKVANQANDCLE